MRGVWISIRMLEKVGKGICMVLLFRIRMFRNSEYSDAEQEEQIS